MSDLFAQRSIKTPAMITASEDSAGPDARVAVGTVIVEKSEENTAGVVDTDEEIGGVTELLSDEVSVGFNPVDALVSGVLRAKVEVAVGFNLVDIVIDGVPRIEVEAETLFSPVDTGVLSVEAEVSSVHVGVGVLRVEVEASPGFNPVDTLIPGVLRVGAEV